MKTRRTDVFIPGRSSILDHVPWPFAVACDDSFRKVKDEAGVSEALDHNVSQHYTLVELADLLT